MKYKMLVLDIDGTLTNNKKEITEYTRKIIVRMQKEGVIVVLASGRPGYGIRSAASQLLLEQYGGFILSYNGGRIMECSTGRIVYEKTIPAETVKHIYDRVKYTDAALMTYEEDAIITEEPDNQYVIKESFINQMQVKKVDNFSDYVKFSPVKCLVAADKEYLLGIENDLKSYFGEQLSIYRSEPYFLEIMSKNIDKAASLEYLLSYTGVDRAQTAACGDGLNDISMIKFAGLGIAMANAQEAAKQVCDYVTKSNEEEGVAYAIEHLILS